MIETMPPLEIRREQVRQRGQRLAALLHYQRTDERRQRVWRAMLKTVRLRDALHLPGRALERYAAKNAQVIACDPGTPERSRREAAASWWWGVFATTFCERKEDS